MAKIKDFLYRYRNIILFIVYSVISIAVLLHHEPFRDELNVWHVLRNVPLKDLPYHVTHDGHPIIYFLFWYPFVKMGLPFVFCRIMAYMVCSAAAFLICTASPFSFIIKAMITFSAPMIYWYSSLARSYSFLPFLVFLLAYLSAKIKDRTDKRYGIYIIIFCVAASLTSNLHLIYGMLGGSIFIVLAYKKIKSRERLEKHEMIAASLFIILLAVPAIQTFIAAGVKPEYMESIKYRTSDIFVYIIRNLVSNWHSPDFIPHEQWINYHIEDAFFAFVFFSIPIVSIILFRVNTWIFFIFAASSLYHLSVYLIKYPIFLPYRIYTFETVLIASVWAAAAITPKAYARQKSTIELLLILILIPAVLSGAEMCHVEWKEPFTAAIAIADYADNNIPAEENTKIYLADASASAGVIFYSKKHKFYDSNDNPIKFIAVYLSRKLYSLPKAQEGKEMYIIEHNKEGTDTGIIKDKGKVKEMFCAYEGIIYPQMCIYKVIE